MSGEEQQRGLQDPTLEVGAKTWRDKVTPTRNGDIGPRARLYMSLRDNAVGARMALEGMSDGVPEEIRASQEQQLKAIRRDVILADFNLKGFDMVVEDTIQHKKEVEAQEEEDARLIEEVRGTLRDEYDEQAQRGEEPVMRDEYGFKSSAPVKGW